MGFEAVDEKRAETSVERPTEERDCRASCEKFGFQIQ